MKFLAGLFLGIILGALLVTFLNTHGTTGPDNAGTDEEPRYQGEPLTFWLAQMENSDPAYRQTAAIALGELGLHDDKVLEAVLKAAGDEDGDVRIMALTSLQRIRPRDPKTIDAFIAALRDS